MNIFTKNPKLYGLPFFIVYMASLFFSITAFAQTGTLTGLVIDEKTKSPLAGATVQIKGSTHKVITNDKGEFIFITAQHLPLTYTVTYVGYQAIEITQKDIPYVSILSNY